MSLVEFVNSLWSILSIVAQMISAVLLVALFSEKVRSLPPVKWLKDNAMLVAYAVSGLAMAGSLTYSDVIGYAPCVLCWFQRIVMYPLVILMGVALYRRDFAMRIYGLILSLIGAATALFHFFGQIGLAPLPCAAVGYSASCSERFVMEFGYITIPMMALSAFLLIALTLLVSLRKDRVAPAA